MTSSADVTLRFDWVRRMGVHEAYHQSPRNRLIHWICIPVELFAVVLLLSAAPFELALPVIAAAGVVFVLAEPIAGALMTALLLLLRIVAFVTTTGVGWIDALVAIGLFAVAFVVQTRVGHGRFEAGRDDTAMNLAELRRTRNPIPILLIFFYHLVELLFVAGWRPDLRRLVEVFTRSELSRIEAAAEEAAAAAAAEAAAAPPR